MALPHASATEMQRIKSLRLAESKPQIQQAEAQSILCGVENLVPRRPKC